MTKMAPPIKDILPRLTRRTDTRRCMENCIDLVGASLTTARSTCRRVSGCASASSCRRCSRRKRRASGAPRSTPSATSPKPLGPGVLVTLLNNLKVQDCQNRVCTTVAIAIVAETCSPFTVLPALMNEYKVPELNVQNGVLKALSFVFEYIGEMGKDYTYAVSPLLEDALMDRDLVHRQTAASVVQHMALGVAGLGCEDALAQLCVAKHLETSHHVVNAVQGAVDGCRLALGPVTVLKYILQGLFHPASDSTTTSTLAPKTRWMDATPAWRMMASIHTTNRSWMYSLSVAHHAALWQLAHALFARA
ncbi:g7936 [Coccomyxa viridis]|uniref:G7936 protein n=1 Tax=Coccomyxa viridis TaxID=1274662 RepID=A0ABP1G1L2_9CHLO